MRTVGTTAGNSCTIMSSSTCSRSSKGPNEQSIAVSKLGRFHGFAGNLQFWAQAKPAHDNGRFLYENVGIGFWK